MPAFSISVGMRLINLAREMEGEIELIGVRTSRHSARRRLRRMGGPGPRKADSARQRAHRSALFRKIWRELLDGEYERGAVILSGSAIAGAVLNSPICSRPAKSGALKFKGFYKI